MTGREILEAVVGLLGRVPEGDQAEEICSELKAWLESVMSSASRRL